MPCAADQVRAHRAGRRRDDGDPDRPCRRRRWRRGQFEQRGQERLVAGLELAAAVERDRPAHPVGWRVVRWRDVLHRRVADSPPRRRGPIDRGATRSGAGDERREVGDEQDREQEPAPIGRIARKNASATDADGISADDPAGDAGQLEPSAGSSTISARTRPMARSQGASSTALMVGPAARATRRDGDPGRAATLTPVRLGDPMTPIAPRRPHHRLARAAGATILPLLARRVHRVARLRGAAAGPAAVLHRAGRRPRDARASSSPRGRPPGSSASRSSAGWPIGPRASR